MRSFKEFNLKASAGNMRGSKIKAREVLGKPIIVCGYKLTDSKFHKGKKCLHLQIEYEGQKRVIFTSGHALVEVIQLVPPDGFPFSTTILKKNDRFEFT